MSFAIVIKATGEVVRETTIINPLVWPNGDVSHGAAEGYEYGEWKVVPVQHDAPPSEFHVLASDVRTAKFDGTRVLMLGQYIERDIYDVKNILCERADSEAEASVLSSLQIGKAQIYQRKLAEAQALAVDQSPDPKNYPLLSATVGIEGKDLAAVAKLVLERADEWAQSAALIERKTKLLKQEIRAAQSVEAATKAFNAARLSQQ